MKFIFIRHAQSVGNKTNILAVPETPITPEGQAASEKLAEEFATPIDVLFSSPLIRTLQSAEPLSHKRGLPIIKNKDLREKEFGSFAGNALEVTDRIKLEHPEYRDKQWGYDYHHWGGESGQDVRERISTFIETVKQDHADKTVVAFTHIAVIRILYIMFEGREYSDHQVIPNLSIHEFDL